MTEYSLCWDSYKNNICNGFSLLQQKQEFVDMTLAAEGHMVKVHQNIIALASPYLKGLIQSASGKHPVIFLNAITHEVLCLILEYIYTGEVRLRRDQMTSFLKAGKALHIAGVEDMISTEEILTGQKKSKIHPDSHWEPEPFRPKAHMEIEPFKRKMASNALSTENDYNKTAQNSLRDTESDDVDYIDDDLITDPTQDPDFRPNVPPPPVISMKKTSTLPLNPSNKKITILSSNITKNRNISVLPLHRLQNKNISTTSSNSLANVVPNVPNNAIRNISSISSNKSESQKPSTMLLDNPLSNLENESISIVPLYNSASPNPASMLPSTGESSNVNESTMSHAFSIKVHSSVVPQTTEQPPDYNEYSITVNPNPEFTAEDQSGMTINKGDAINAEKGGIEKADKISNHLDTLARYSLSNRGALQLVVNRFIYYCHHNSAGGRKRRWRCIDYRRGQCKAYIDSVGDRITNRKYGHKHPFHDKQIIKKMDKNMLFDTVVEAQQKADSRDSEPLEQTWTRNNENDGSDIEVA